MECILLAGNYSNLSEHGIYNIIKENALYLAIDYVDDCLHLLDSRFDQLRVLSPRSRTISIIHKEKLLNLKCFSLSCNLKIYFYDEAVILFVHRMPNLEELRFYFKCSRKKSFVDENDLTANIIKHSKQIDLLTNEHIENTFREYPNNQIISCVDYFSNKNDDQCYVYSYPFTLTNYDHCVDDCLHLLDGRFDQFRVLSPRSRTISIIHKEKLLNLKCFSLSCNLKIYFYDEAVIPFLHRMPNLEELRFYFKCSRKKSFVDGNDLTANIIKHSNQIDLLTNEHIENTFRGFPNNQIIF
ncbi:unnamed protein product [Rotaria sp. Silwood1]|nr:unnamed protein product [Rotaria sp. Silwood1]